MEKSIWKYTLEVSDLQCIKMPQNARILTLAIQNEKPCIWALVSPEAPLEDRWIETLTTGLLWEKQEGKYIGTYQLHNFVGHVFDGKK